MTVFSIVEARMHEALAELVADGRLPSGLDTSNIELQEPRDPTHGDMALNAGLVLAKPAKMKPRDIAELLKDKLATLPGLTRAEIAGPGFLNLAFEAAAWHRTVADVLREGSAFGRGDMGTKKRAQVEYVSANPTGPMHVGHCRGAVFGDALANILAFSGFEVTREYYINDAGAQVAKLGASTYLRYLEALGETIGAIPEGLYPGEYLRPIGAALAKKYGDTLKAMSDAKRNAICRDAAIAINMTEIEADLVHLGVRHDVFFSERSLTTNGANRDKIQAAIEVLEGKGLIFQGRLERPKGHDEDDWEDREQKLFRSTQFGDDQDRALIKSDGGYTYFAGDLGYHYDKIERGFDRYYNVLGADHVGYIPRLKAAVAALSDGKAIYETPVCNIVRVMRNGEIVRMSKRAGTFVALRDVVDEVGGDAVRFMMLMRRHDSALDFDLAKVVEQSKDNPVFYVQYAHARAKSVARAAAEAHREAALEPAVLAAADLSRLTDPGEIDLIKRVARFPRVVALAARDSEPHRIPFYLFDVASAFHAQYSAGNPSPQLRFIQNDDVSLTIARLALVKAIELVMANGLRLLGVTAPEEMR
jgi:arginyl-tRNA synthetase